MLLVIIILILSTFFIGVFIIFFDQAVIVRRGTIYRVDGSEKLVALTFDDGPSPLWTPKILNELKKSGIKATFFMLGDHVQKYPEFARQVAEEGHEIGNHSYGHDVLVYYKTEELEKTIKDTEKIVRGVTGQNTKYFRPPKAWLMEREKKKIREMGYKIVLWSLNSKDWVSFNYKYIIRYLMRNVRAGDIILFHDSGNVFGREGGSQQQTIKTLSLLLEKLKEKGFRCVTISELLNKRQNAKDTHTS